MCSAERFTRLALGEVHRRGVETAGRVVAPMDGSDWCQTFLDVHRPDAVRILDFPHAVEHLSAAAHATWGAEAAEAATWVQRHAHALKTAGPAGVLAALRALPTEAATLPLAAARERDRTLAYLEKRLAQLQYPQFQAQGYPIGSGSIESANKLVAEARLKGAGMHWAPGNVNPLLALRGIVCSERWAERWPQVAARRRMQGRQRRTARQRARHPLPPPPLPDPPPRPRQPTRPLASLPPSHTPTIVNGRPTAQHPWKRRPFLTRHPATDAKV